MRLIDDCGRLILPTFSDLFCRGGKGTGKAAREASSLDLLVNKQSVVFYGCR